MAGAIATTRISKTAPFLVVAILWTATWFWMMLRRNKRKARALQLEIEDLGALRKPHEGGQLP
jgi:hypothetical protein